MSSSGDNLPIGVRFLQKLSNTCCPNLHFNREWYYRSSVLILTYFAYTCYHLTRKPLSVVKAVLSHNCSQGTTSPHMLLDENGWCGWAPFDGSAAEGSALLGTLDSAFLFAYAIAMFASGFIAERINLRYFLSLGMLLSGVFCYLFGVAKTYNIHSFGYLVFVQASAGIFQTTGWPGVVTVVGNWFGKSKRGLIYGLWNSHTSLGNILGSLIAAKYVETDWSLSFIIPGLIIGAFGFVIFLFLVVRPTDVGCVPPDTSNHRQTKPYRVLENRVANIESPSGDSSETDDTEILVGDQEVQRRITERSYLLRARQEQPEIAIGFMGACRIPGVIEFSLCLFFSKLVSYTFLYWLPMYVEKSTEMGPTLSADFSILFDVGGIIGAILAGVISDYTGMSATTCVCMLFVAAPMMFIYPNFSSINIAANVILLIIVGILVNGPYALITTAVSAELGTHSSIGGNSKALATVTAIIDGTGSIGAAVGPLLAGYLNVYGWQAVFYMLMVSDALALMLLLRLVKQELIQCRHRRQIRRE